MKRKIDAIDVVLILIIIIGIMILINPLLNNLI